jgi:hypothetical protein
MLVCYTASSKLEDDLSFKEERKRIAQQKLKRKIEAEREAKVEQAQLLLREAGMPTSAASIEDVTESASDSTSSSSSRGQRRRVRVYENDEAEEEDC